MLLGFVGACCHGDEASLEQLQALTKVFVPEQVQDDFIEVLCMVFCVWRLPLWMRLCSWEGWLTAEQPLRCVGLEQVQDAFIKVCSMPLHYVFAACLAGGLGCRRG
jgi:hypothetical protein